MSGIRVTYSGLISFGVGIISVMTGIIFTLIITRQLSLEEFGTWNLIGGLITYVMIFEPIISYWAIRQTSRGLKIAKTAVITSGFFSCGGIIAYIIIAYFVGQQSDAVKDVLFLAAILVPMMFVKQTLNSINLGWKPQSVSYGLLVFESTKIPAAMIFVYFLDLGIMGAILSTFVAYVGNIIILVIYARAQLKDRFNRKIVKRWLSLSWLPIYPGVASLVYSLDVVIFSVITGSVIGIAFYSVALTIAALVAHSGLISQAIYPKLLGGGKREHLQENLIKFLYFGIPLTALSITFAKPALFALNPVYDVAVIVVIIMTIRAFLYVLTGVIVQTLRGIETVDMNEESTFKDFIKSKLFSIPTIILMQSSLYVVILTIGILLLKPVVSTGLDLVVYWAIISLVTQIPFLMYFYSVTKKSFSIFVDRGSLFRYLFVSIGVFGATYILVEKFLVYKNSIYEFLPNVLFFVLIAITGYLAITYLIDLKTRTLFKAIINEIKNKPSHE